MKKLLMIVSATPLIYLTNNWGIDKDKIHLVGPLGNTRDITKKDAKEALGFIENSNVGVLKLSNHTLQVKENRSLKWGYVTIEGSNTMENLKNALDSFIEDKEYIFKKEGKGFAKELAGLGYGSTNTFAILENTKTPVFRLQYFQNVFAIHGKEIKHLKEAITRIGDDRDFRGEENHVVHEVNDELTFFISKRKDPSYFDCIRDSQSFLTSYVIMHNKPYLPGRIIIKEEDMGSLMTLLDRAIKEVNIK
jgi:hypothetical protein